MFEKYTTRARTVIGFARQEALRLNHDYIGTEHLLLGLLYLGTTTETDVLMGMAQPQTVKNEIEKVIIPAPSRHLIGSIPFTPRSKKVLELAYEEAEKRNQKIGIAYLLLALTREEDCLASQALKAAGITYDGLLAKAPPISVHEFLKDTVTRAPFEPGLTVDPDDLQEEKEAVKPPERRPSEETVSRLAFLASEMITQELAGSGYQRNAEQKHQLYQALMQTLAFHLRAGPILPM